MIQNGYWATAIEDEREIKIRPIIRQSPSPTSEEIKSEGESKLKRQDRYNQDINWG